MMRRRRCAPPTRRVGLLRLARVRVSAAVRVTFSCPAVSSSHRDLLGSHTGSVNRDRQLNPAASGTETELPCCQTDSPAPELVTPWDVPVTRFPPQMAPLPGCHAGSASHGQSLRLTPSQCPGPWPGAAAAATGSRLHRDCLRVSLTGSDRGLPDAEPRWVQG